MLMVRHDDDDDISSNVYKRMTGVKLLLLLSNILNYLTVCKQIMNRILKFDVCKRNEVRLI